MIDIESTLFSDIADDLRRQYPGIFVAGETTATPSKFPAVTIVEADNAVYQRMRTTQIENAVRLMYEVNIYSNKIGYKKSEAKDILETIDGEFSRLGFTRTACNPISNLQDASIYRILARYEAIVDRNYMVYQN